MQQNLQLESSSQLFIHTKRNCIFHKRRFLENRSQITMIAKKQNLNYIELCMQLISDTIFSYKHYIYDEYVMEMNRNLLQCINMLYEKHIHTGNILFPF